MSDQIVRPVSHQGTPCMFLRRPIRVAPKIVTRRREYARHARSQWPWSIIWLEERVLLVGSLQSPVSIAIGSAVPGLLAAGGADFYAIEPNSNGRLIAESSILSETLRLRLSLYNAQGSLLVQSDGQSIGRVDPLIDQHVTAGADILEVQSLSGTGAYSLSTSLTPASDPFQTLVLDPSFQEGNHAPLAVGDFNNDKILDIVGTDGVHLGTGDGTFQAPTTTGALVDPSQSVDPSAIAVGDFNGDHNLDVAIAFAATDSISISLGNGDGSFQKATTIGLPAGSVPSAIVAGDFAGNGLTDLAVVDSGNNANNVTILLNNDDEGFRILAPIPVGLGPVSITEGDFQQNGRLDLAVADINSGDVTILSSNGDGTFQALAPIELPTGSTPTAIVAGDFGTGHLDVAVTDSSRSVVDILQGDGDGTFHLASSYSVGGNPSAIVTGDFGNGHLGLATADANTNDVSVLLGNGDGTFQTATRSVVGSGPLALVAGNFNGDGRLDLATGNVYSNDISVLLGKGDGTFEEPTANAVGNSTAALATGDFTGNGNLGVAVVNQGSDSVTILPGNGDGTFQHPLTVLLPKGSGASAVVTADFNGDGRTDLAVADPSLNEISVLLGNGDGTFQSLAPISIAGAPYAIAVGDFTGNGRIDLAVADRSSSTVSVLLGNGDGTFQILPPIPLAKPYSFPTAIVAGNFTGNGHTDLAVADLGTDDVTVLLGNGKGAFEAQAPVSLGGGTPYALSLVAGDFRKNGITDLVVANADFGNGDSLDVLLGNGDGTFQTPSVLPIGFFVTPVALVAGDFNGDGQLDLATVDGNGNGTDDYSVYRGNGDGTFQGPSPFALGGIGGSTAIVTGDFSGDGRTDLAIARTSPDDVVVRLSNGDDTFSDPSVVDLVRRERPVIADVNGDGAADVSVVDAAGDILYRAGRPGQPGSFAPPIKVNPHDPSRDVAFVTTDLGPLLAGVDANDNKISFFALRSTGFVLVAKLATGSLPAQILTADLDGNGQSDLIVRNAGDGTISVFVGDGHGWFLPRIDLPVGLGVSDIQAADLHQDGRLDIIYSDRLSGEVGVLENLGGEAFAPPVLYRAGGGPYGIAGATDPSLVSSLEETTGVAVGTFTPGGLPSVVALDPGSNTIGLLSGMGEGQLSNPTMIATAANGLVVRAIDFGSGILTGLAILSPEGLSIERNDGRGGFLPPTTVDVGFEPNGLAVADLNGDGKPDLLVSNPLGDVLVLVGNGDGTFQSVRNVDQQVSLAVYAASGNAPAAFIFADKLTDQLVVQTGGGTTVLGDSSTGLISPGAVKLADLNNNGILDLIVANSGSNNVLIYPGLGNGTFGPALNDGHGFFTGTNPAGITVADVNNDGRLDLIIANKGSNDVSILLNEAVAGGGFTFIPGPRLGAGDGPVATALVNVKANGLPDLLVANSGSNQVWLLQGIGNGFFNDQKPLIYPVGTDPSALLVGNFTGGTGTDLVTINSGSNDLTLISGLGTGSPVFQSVSSGGIGPTAAFAAPITGDGLDSLVVANNGDGNIALLLAGENGLTLTSVLSSPGLPNPSALALASFSNGQMEFYAANEGVDFASLLGFQLEESSALSSASSSASSAGGAQLLSLNESSLALIGTLLTITIDVQNESNQTVEGAAAPAASTGSGASGQSLIKRFQIPELDDHGEAESSVDAKLLDAAPWARFVNGVDQAIERIRSEADERLMKEQEPAKAQEPDKTLLDEHPNAPQTETVSPLELAAIRRIETERDRFGAIDLAIGSWNEGGAPQLRSLLPHTPAPTIRTTPSLVAQLVEPALCAKPPSRDQDDSRAVGSQVSRMATLMAISATTVTAREILIGRAGLPHRLGHMARKRRTAAKPG